MELFITSSIKRAEAWLYRLVLLSLLLVVGGLVEVYAQFYPSQVERVERIILGTSGDVEAHHIIPWELLEHGLIQKVALDGFHPNMLENGIGLKKYSKLLGKGLHGNHPAYKKYIESKILEQFPDWHTATPQQANKYLQEALIPELKSLIIKAEQSGLNLNEYFKSVNNEIF